MAKTICQYCCCQIRLGATGALRRVGTLLDPYRCAHSPLSDRAHAVQKPAELGPLSDAIANFKRPRVQDDPRVRAIDYLRYHVIGFSEMRTENGGLLYDLAVRAPQG